MDKEQLHKFISKVKGVEKPFNETYTNLTRKSFHFDLDTKLLNKYYDGGNNYRKAYSDIKRFLRKNGFEHEQGSGYTSIKPMYDFEAIKIAMELKSAFSWVEKCIKIFTITDYQEQKNITHLMTKSKPDVLPLGKNPPEKNKTFTISRQQINDLAKKVSEVQNERTRSKHLQRDEPTK